MSSLDLSRTAYPTPLGSRHPLNIVRDEIIQIFARLGFSVEEGPEIEDDWHVFESLNFADDHPARDMQGYFLRKSCRKYPASDSYLFSSDASDGADGATDTDYLSRESL